MYNVVLVDDEAIDLEGLRRLVPWPDLNMQVSAAVNSGFEALNVLDEQVDILVTDIKMPIMSGLELAEKARRRHPRLKVLFISGYEDFQYARQAISMGAGGYVLKPVDDDELMAALRNLAGQLDQERRRKQLETRYRESLPLLLNESLLQWLEGNGSMEEAVSLWEQEGRVWKQPGSAAVVEIDDLALKLKAIPEEGRPQVIEAMYAVLVQRVEGSLGGPCCRMPGHRLALLLPQATDREKLERLIADMMEYDGLSITIGWGTEAADPEEIPSSCRKALQALSSKMFLGKGRLIDSHMSGGEMKRDVTELEASFARLFDAAARYELVQVHDILEELFFLVRSLNSKLSVYHLALYVFTKLDNYLQSIGENVYRILDIRFDQLNELLQLETVDDIQAWLRRRLFEISEFLHAHNRKPGRKLIAEMESYVDEHLGDNLTLRDVANHFGFSPNYLGTLFKEDKGENFSDYLIRKRMEMARELLGDARLKIYEVAERVGYRNLPYFSKQFRERFGMSPGDFRKLRGRV